MLSQLRWEVSACFADIVEINDQYCSNFLLFLYITYTDVVSSNLHQGEAYNVMW